MLELDKIKQATATLQPFPHLVAPAVLTPEHLKRIAADYPRLPGAGSFPTEGVNFGKAFAELLTELSAPPLAEILQEKLQVPLQHLPTMVTVRGFCREKDGQVHADSVEKVVTVLLYLNTEWQDAGGRLRLLNSPDLTDSFMEVPPEAGTLLAFRCDRNAWHGHESYTGERRTLQLNWVSSEAWLRRERLRHRLSGTLKKWRRALWPPPLHQPAHFQPQQKDSRPLKKT